MSGYPKSDARKPADRKRLLGQVITPGPIASKMVKSALRSRSADPLEFLDPCVGPYTFPEIAFRSKLLRCADRLTLFDLDSSMIDVCRTRSTSNAASHSIAKRDYLTYSSDRQYDVTILNPPYVRQEWIDKKEEYRSVFRERLGVRIPGTSNLYVYFVVKTISELRSHGRFSMVLFDSWQNTRYGQWMWEYLQSSCDDLSVEAAEPTPFDGCLIDATIISGVKADDTKPVSKSTIANDCITIQGFGRIGDVIETRRGLRLKQADFFLCKDNEAKVKGATQFVKKLGGFSGYRVPEERVQEALIVTKPSCKKSGLFRELERRLTIAQTEPYRNASVLNWHRQYPETWYVHGVAPYAPVIFNYYLRNRPRHLYNPAFAYSDNFYGATPPEGISPLVLLAVMNSTAVATCLLENARNQGNGLAKLQLFEYRRALMPDLSLIRGDIKLLAGLTAYGESLVQCPTNASEIISKVDHLLASHYADSRLDPAYLTDAYLAADRNSRRPRQ